jgi:hypothetical protein
LIICTLQESCTAKVKNLSSKWFKRVEEMDIKILVVNLAKEKFHPDATQFAQIPSWVRIGTRKLNVN